MSAGNFKRLITKHVVNILKEANKFKGSQETRNIEAKQPAVLEINSSIIYNNVEGIKDRSQAGRLAASLVKAIHSVRPNMQKFDPDSYEEPVKGSHVRYMGGRKGEMVLIAPSYNALRAILTAASHTPRLKRTPIGTVFETRRIEHENGDYEDVTKEWSKVDLGHVSQGPTNTTDRSPTGRDTIGSLQIKELFKVLPTVAANTRLMHRYLKKLNKIHAEYHTTYTKTINKMGESFANFKFIYLIPQSHTLNLQLAAAEARLMRELGSELITTETSVPFIVGIIKKISNLFHDKKDIVGKSKSDTKGMFDIELPKRRAKTSVVGADRLRDVKGKFTSPINLMNLLNARLHDQIQANMGKGNATKILNYRTGRFARSAEVLSLEQTGKNSLVANYTYMRNPYDVFLPGGRLHKPGRDPEKLINRSIRQLAVQLVNKRFRVKPNLMGAL